MVPRATLTPLPGAPVDLIGLLRLRGALCPVIDIRARLGLPATAPHIGECIIVMHTTSFTVGLLIERMAGVVVPPPDAIDRPVSIDNPARLIRGVLEVAGQVVATLDADALVGNDVRAYLAASANGLHCFADQIAA